MRLSSHMRIADITADIIEEITQIKINKKMMRIGSVMPDILPNRRRQLHLPSKVADQYNKELMKIIDKSRGIKMISFVLGILTHYITDAFCLSHNVYVINLKKHIAYEYYLNDFKETYQVPDEIIGTIHKYIEKLKDYEYSTKDYIEIMNKEYNRLLTKEDWRNNAGYDLEQAIIHVSTLMSNFLLQLENEKLVFTG